MANKNASIYFDDKFIALLAKKGLSNYDEMKAILEHVNKREVAIREQNLDDLKKIRSGLEIYPPRRI